MQLEGSKRWRVYEPADDKTLPLTGSADLPEDSIGDPIIDVVLQPGDLLYLPRGFVHQATTPANTHSLHTTITTGRKNTWGRLELIW